MAHPRLREMESSSRVVTIKEMPEHEPIELTPELLNDFYAECDEHLGAIRRSLVALESANEHNGASHEIDKLFRSFHSLKGMAGIAGIHSAETLAHRAEDYLRDLLSDRLKLTSEGLDLLANVIQFLDRTIAAFRDKQPLPDSAPLANQFIPLLSTGPPTESVPASEQKDESSPLERQVEQAGRRGLSVVKATFVPSTELNERGVNVNAIRSRLEKIGEIIHAAPQIGLQGDVAFEFYVALPHASEDLSELEADGVQFDRIAAPGSVSPQPAPAKDAARTHLAAAGRTQVIRVELQRLDDLLRITGELVIQRARLEDQVQRLSREDGIEVHELQEVQSGFARHVRDLRDSVMRLRMVPIAEVFDRMPFVVRDLTRGSEKKVRLEIRGQLTELDKYVVERLRDPLLHLVRNAVSHGIEDAGERIAAGKPAEATIGLYASASGDAVCIEVADDGRGIDVTNVAEQAKRLGLPVPDPLDATALLDLISMPGFSTREEADRAAGRGVGMVVVASTVRELGGTLSLDTAVGRGARFRMRLPLTLLITDALIVSLSGQQFAVPQNSVDQVLDIEENQVRRIERAELVSVRGTVLPLIRLRAVLGFPRGTKAHLAILVSLTERGRVGLVVDHIAGQRQIVVRPIRDPLLDVPGVIGATELGDGRPLLILDATALARQSESGSARMPAFAGYEEDYRTV